MRVVGFLGFVVLLMFVSLGYSQVFVEEFDDTSNIQSASMNIANGVAEIGYPQVYGTPNWYNEWGNFAYYGGYFYVVWSDGRYDGQDQVFLTKIDTSGNVVFSTNVEVSIVGATNTYYEFALRPTVSVFDANNIYVSFLQFKNGKYYTYTTKWQDTATTLNLVWGKRVDNGFGDNISYTPIPWKLSSAVGANGELYLLQVWNRVGSGETSWISKILPDGTLVANWFSAGAPGRQQLTIFNSGSFIIAGEVIYLDGYIYVSGQHWIWSPSKDYGVGINKISTNDIYATLWGNGTNITTDRGIIYNNTRSLAPKVSMLTVDSNIYITFADQRNGNMDVFLVKINTNNGAREWTKTIVSSSYNEEYPSIYKDSVGNLYISYVEWSSGIPILKLAKVDKDTGNVLGTMSFDSLLSSGSSGFYLPKFFIDGSDDIYVFFKEDAGGSNVKLQDS